MKKSLTTECIPSLTRAAINGYAHIGKQGAHVAAWDANYPDRPRNGLYVRHLCGTKNCINPKHLALGTQAENMADEKATGALLGKKRKPCKECGGLLGTTDGCKWCKWTLQRRIHQARYRERLRARNGEA